MDFSADRTLLTMTLPLSVLLNVLLWTGLYYSLRTDLSFLSGPSEDPGWLSFTLERVVEDNAKKEAPVPVEETASAELNDEIPKSDGTELHPETSDEMISGLLNEPIPAEKESDVVPLSDISPDKLITGDVSEISSEERAALLSRLNDSIGSFLSTHKDEVSASIMEECRDRELDSGRQWSANACYRQRPVLTAPPTNTQASSQVQQLFRDYHESDHSTRYIRHYQTQNRALAQMLEENSESAVLAREKMSLNEDKIRYLNREFLYGTKANICRPGPCVFRFSDTAVLQEADELQEVNAFLQVSGTEESKGPQAMSSAELSAE